MTKNDEKDNGVRFYCEKYSQLSTIVAGELIQFHAHEYRTSSEVEIKALDKMLDVQRYEKAMEKKQLIVDGASRKKLEDEVKKDIIENFKKDPKSLAALKDEIKAEMKEELGEEYEKALEESIKEKLIKNPPKEIVKQAEEDLVKKPTKALIDAVKKLDK